MKYSCHWTCMISAVVLILFPTEGRLQDAVSDPGFLNIVNLVSLESPTFFSVEDFQLNGGTPSIPGSESGFISINPGEYSFTVSNEAAEPESEARPISIESGKNLIIICYDDSKTSDDGTVRSKLRCNVLVESLDENLPRLSVVSLLHPEQVSGRIRNNQVMFPQRRALLHSVELNDIVPIYVGNEEVEEVDIATNAHYIVFLFQDPETSGVATSVVVNKEFEFQITDDDSVTSKED